MTDPQRPEPPSTELITEIAQLRREYTRSGLSRRDLAPDPFRQFSDWLAEAVRLELPEPNAATLATADAAGRPSARIVLLKGFDPGDGFTFFTNYASRKGRELAANPRGCLLFFWAELERQVRVEGSVERLPAEVSDEYFASRPRGSRLGAWASPQSEPLPDRAALEARLAAVVERFGDDEPVPRPEHWGGYRLVPEELELWQGRTSRLHDRLVYRRTATGEPWTIERLAP